MRVVWRFARPAVGTPTRGSTFLVYQPEAPSPLKWPPRSLLWAPVLRTRARSLHAALLLRTPPGGRGKKGDIDCVAPMGPLSRTHPPIWAPPRSIRKRLVGLRRPNLRPRTSRGMSPSPPSPPDLTPPPPPLTTDRPSSLQGQRQQRQRTPRFQGHLEIHGPK
jgi:hypothetical protein